MKFKKHKKIRKHGDSLSTLVRIMKFTKHKKIRKYGVSIADLTRLREELIKQEIFRDWHKIMEEDDICFLP